MRLRLLGARTSRSMAPRVELYTAYESGLQKFWNKHRLEVGRDAYVILGIEEGCEPFCSQPRSCHLFKKRSSRLP